MALRREFRPIATDAPPGPKPVEGRPVVRGNVAGAAVDFAVLQSPARLEHFRDPLWAATFLHAVPAVRAMATGPMRCEVVPLKLRESRGTGVMMYVLQVRGEDGSMREVGRLVGKVTSDRHGPPTGEKSFALLNDLWADGFAAGPLRVPRPIAYLRPSRFMLMAAVPGKDLITLFKEGDPAVPEAVRMAALWAAKLHSSSMHWPSARSPERQANKVVRVAHQFVEAYPELQAATDELAQRLIASIGSATPDDLAPIHGDFLLKNLIVCGRTITAIDLEEAGRFDPAKDVGKFLANLAVKAAVYRPPFDIAALQREFLRTYREASGRDLRGREHAYHALGLLKHARRQPDAQSAQAWLEAGLRLLEGVAP